MLVDQDLTHQYIHFCLEGDRSRDTVLVQRTLQ